MSDIKPSTDQELSNQLLGEDKKTYNFLRVLALISIMLFTFSSLPHIISLYDSFSKEDIPKKVLISYLKKACSKYEFRLILCGCGDQELPIRAKIEYRKDFTLEEARLFIIQNINLLEESLRDFPKSKLERAFYIVHDFASKIQLEYTFLNSDEKNNVSNPIENTSPYIAEVDFKCNKIKYYTLNHNETSYLRHKLYHEESLEEALKLTNEATSQFTE